MDDMVARALHAARQHFDEGGFLDSLRGMFSGPDYLSTGEVASPTNWGNPDSAADFFKADRAAQLAREIETGRDVPMPPRRPPPVSQESVEAAPPLRTSLRVNQNPNLTPTTDTTLPPDVGPYAFVQSSAPHQFGPAYRADAQPDVPGSPTQNYTLPPAALVPPAPAAPAIPDRATALATVERLHNAGVYDSPELNAAGRILQAHLRAEADNISPEEALRLVGGPLPAPTAPAPAAIPSNVVAITPDKLTDRALPEQSAADAVWARMIRQESGNRQFDRNGRTITSPAGALGISQVMPSTGPEAAQLAGLPWSLERLRTDPEYNHALGRAYYDAQLERFGDPTLAAAAYNGGPGRVAQALRLAQQTGRPWTAFLQPETQNYVRVVGRAEGGRTGQYAEGGEVDSALDVVRKQLAGDGGMSSSAIALNNATSTPTASIASSNPSAALAYAPDVVSSISSTPTSAAPASAVSNATASTSNPYGSLSYGLANDPFGGVQAATTAPAAPTATENAANIGTQVGAQVGQALSAPATPEAPAAPEAPAVSAGPYGSLGSWSGSQVGTPASVDIMGNTTGVNVGAPASAPAAPAAPSEPNAPSMVAGVQAPTFSAPPAFATPEQLQDNPELTGGLVNSISNATYGNLAAQNEAVNSLNDVFTIGSNFGSNEGNNAGNSSPGDAEGGSFGSDGSSAAGEGGFGGEGGGSDGGGDSGGGDGGGGDGGGGGGGGDGGGGGGEKRGGYIHGHGVIDHALHAVRHQSNIKRQKSKNKLKKGGSVVDRALMLVSRQA